MRAVPVKMYTHKKNFLLIITSVFRIFLALRGIFLMPTGIVQAVRGPYKDMCNMSVWGGGLHLQYRLQGKTWASYPTENCQGGYLEMCVRLVYNGGGDGGEYLLKHITPIKYSLLH